MTAIRRLAAILAADVAASTGTWTSIDSGKPPWISPSVASCSASCAKVTPRHIKGNPGMLKHSGHPVRPLRRLMIHCSAPSVNTY